MAFLASFLQYLIIFIILVAVACLGVFLGRLMRKRSDAKRAEAAVYEGDASDGVQKG